MKQKISNLLENDGFKSFLASAVSILSGVLIGFLVMVLITFVNDKTTIKDAFGGLQIILSGPFSSTITRYMIVNTGNMLFYAVPLIFTGLSVTIAWKTGLFNIGAPGQFIMGIIGSLTVALSIQTTGRVEGILVWLLALLVGTLMGALWAMIPGLLKAFFNINEVIICIMTNWIAANISSWFFTYQTGLQSTEGTKGGFLAKVVNNYTPKMGLDKLFPS